MKLLYSLLITLVVAAQNFQLSQGYPGRGYCSSECELKYFPNLRLQSMWSQIFLPLPTSENDWNETCSRTNKFLSCSELATVGCRKGYPPMVTLGQIKDAYGYLCDEGASDFEDVMHCLNTNYKQEETNQCRQQRKPKKPRGPDGDLCLELENVQNCSTENAMKKCGKLASDFMSIYVQKTHKEIKKLVNCDKFISA